MEKIEIDKLTIKNCYEIIDFLDGMVNPSDLSDEQKLAINLLLIELKGLIKDNPTGQGREQTPLVLIRKQTENKE